ncbi:MAG TPA: FHA domain-containing protein [Polyangiaceae bacterium]|jgi:diguanylate cyclase (GGDEF)-like protein|nr:FHA domain-containing protein [Polyangiaceae bacterium]
MTKIKTSARALPAKPNLEHLKKQARALHKAVRRGDASAEARAARLHPQLARAERFDAEQFSLSDAQLVLAREYGFESWPKLGEHVARSVPARDAVASAESAESAESALAEPLFARLALFARQIDWLSMAELRRLRAASDVDGLVLLGLSLLNARQKEELAQIAAPAEKLRALCDALDALAKEGRPLPLGASEPRREHVEDTPCLVVLHAARHPHLLGRRYALAANRTSIGRHDSNQIVFHDHSVSREHARIERRGADFVLIDERSKNGSFVNDALERVREHVLADGDRVAIGQVIASFLSSAGQAEKYRAAISYIAERDALTHCYNQKSWLVATERAIFAARGAERPLAALLCEMSELAACCARLGPLAENALLAELGRRLHSACGSEALIGRIGETRFALALSGASAAVASSEAARLAAAVAERPFIVRGEPVAVSIRIGVAVLYRSTGLDELVADAEARLELARQSENASVVGPEESAA